MKSSYHYYYVLAIIFSSQYVCSWREWTWDNTTENDPGKRQGHSMVLYKSQVVIFGGRSDDDSKEHIPKTYKIRDVDGTLEFETYTDKQVFETCTAEQNEKEHQCKVGPQESKVGVYFNDVRSYDIDCTRYADQSCEENTWSILDPGVEGGGCEIRLGAMICSHPSERWYHGAETFNDRSMIIYGGFSQQCEDYCDDMWEFDFEKHSWTELAELGNQKTGPGKRWKFSSSSDGVRMYIYGGFRIWHGFATENSELNNWSDLRTYPEGGYLDDLWVYTRENNSWSEIEPPLVEVCLDGDATSNVLNCAEKPWPMGRAGHASVLHYDSLYIHGGYRTFFPYPSSSGPGSNRGVLSSGNGGFIPYPTNPYYLDELWQYNFTTSLWRTISPTGNVKPGPRMDHSLINADGIFVLFGGYRSNYFYHDTWQYNATAEMWLNQDFFVHALYPEGCTDDLEHRKAPHSGEYFPWDAPDDIPPEDGVNFIKERHYGTQEFSVFAEPARGLVAFSTSSDDDTVKIPQARRKAPGWDGCRDRHDHRVDLPQLLQWAHPSQRASHSAIYHPEFSLLLLYGGFGFREENPSVTNASQLTETKGDLWQFSLANCPKNCSTNGECFFGKCICADGYYGLDCSNATCPGSTCATDPSTKVQTCRHCCFAGYEHTEEDDGYVPNIQKRPCTSDETGYVNGVCDGFGKCVCRPPFLGDDCSMRDCRYNCSGHGYCSVEFPNSRCMCDLGWVGQYCDTRVCLNNCSAPNGECVNGTCYCAMRHEPYNRDHAWYPYMGEDCSFLVPFASADWLSLSSAIVALYFIVCVIV